MSAAVTAPSGIARGSAGAISQRAPPLKAPMTSITPIRSRSRHRDAVAGRPRPAGAGAAIERHEGGEGDQDRRQAPRGPDRLAAAGARAIRIARDQGDEEQGRGSEEAAAPEGPSSSPQLSAITTSPIPTRFASAAERSTG